MSTRNGPSTRIATITPALLCSQSPDLRHQDARAPPEDVLDESVVMEISDGHGEGALPFLRGALNGLRGPWDVRLEMVGSV